MQILRDLLQRIHQPRPRPRQQIGVYLIYAPVFHRRRILKNLVRFLVVFASERMIASGFNAEAVSLLNFGYADPDIGGNRFSACCLDQII